MNLLGYRSIATTIVSEKWKSVKDSPCRSGLIERGNSSRALFNVNRWVNRRLTYKPDGGPNRDYWQTPDESLNFNTGDCEDYAILKRAILLTDGGFEDDQLQLLVVKDLLLSRIGRPVHHAVLLVDWEHCLDIHMDKVAKIEDYKGVYIPLAAMTGEREFCYIRIP